MCMSNKQNIATEDLLEAVTTDRFINECNIVIIEENNDNETNDDVKTADGTRDGDDGSASANLNTTNNIFPLKRPKVLYGIILDVLFDHESFTG